jgi:DNA glycosylase AlkZ-like
MTITDPEIVQLRLLNQRISLPTFAKPEEVVNWLGAVQAQDYFGAKWSVGLRMRSAKDNAIDQAFNDGSILRTHLLRPTWHFVTPEDIRWLLALTAPQVHKISAYMVRNVKLDDSIFKRSDVILGKALEGGNQLTRDELKGVLERAGIATNNGVRTSYLMMHAELEGIICSGGRRGKQFTYALLDERAPQTGTLAREEALAELARRYFVSRGPATVQDFAKWSGLTVADARGGLEAIKSDLQRETSEGNVYWFSGTTAPEKMAPPTAHLLSVYDEYISSYKDRSAMAGEALTKQFRAMGNALQYIIIVDGQYVGTWKRILKKDAVIIQLNPLTELNKEENEVITGAARKYGTFLDLPVVLETVKF